MIEKPEEKLGFSEKVFSKMPPSTTLGIALWHFEDMVGRRDCIWETRDSMGDEPCNLQEHWTPFPPWWIKSNLMVLFVVEQQVWMDDHGHFVLSAGRNLLLRDLLG